MGNSEIPFNTISNSFPAGFVGAPLRNPDYQKTLLGGAPDGGPAHEPNGQTYQWNLAVQRHLPYGVAIEAAYAGLHGLDLPVFLGINQIPDRYLNRHRVQFGMPNQVFSTTNGQYLRPDYIRPKYASTASNNRTYQFLIL